jgi:hypothetical protein
VAGDPPTNARYEGRRKHIPSRRPSFTNACARERQLPHRTFLRHSERRVDGAVLNDACSRNSVALVIETSPLPFALEHAGKQSAAVFGG